MKMKNLVRAVRRVVLDSMKDLALLKSAIGAHRTSHNVKLFHSPHTTTFLIEFSLPILQQHRVKCLLYEHS
jgi:hypothetical protein